MAIREWLLNHAKQELFSFDQADFEQESHEILEEYAEAADPVTENANRSHYWQFLQAWQQDREYLSSLNFHKIIARHVRNSCIQARTSPNIQSWVELGLESARLDGPQLANEIENAIRIAWRVRTPYRADAVHKFSEELSFENLDKFHLGLEKIIGYPPTNSDFLDHMKREHEQCEPFQDKEGRNVDPKVEWNIVMRSNAWNIIGTSCEPTFDIKKREVGKPLEFYIQKANGICTKNETLIEAEVAALRLWTGPMHNMYAEMFRNPKKSTKSSCPFVTTLHALNSGITKLARIWRLPPSRKVYRGYRNLSLKELKKDVYQCVGGVEKSVLATSEDFETAVHYSGDRAFILEIDVGQVNRGADVSWLSQFPHEREILFNALSNIEFVCSPQVRFVQGRGMILVYQVCVSANVKCKTLKEFLSLRQDLHLNLVDVLSQEVRRMIYLREVDSRHGLIKRLCGQCRNQCDVIVEQAGEADVRIFNEGEPAYVTLVEDAILLRSRALQIIDLASQWFETAEVKPADLDRLQDWQLEALRTAFRSSEGPQAMTIVLEQVRVVSSLFTTQSLDLGAVHKSETVRRVAKLLTLNPNLNDLKMEVAACTAEVWEQVFRYLCPGRPMLRVNGFFLAEYATINTLQQLELRNFDIQMAAMIAPALQFHTPNALTSLSLWGSPIGCGGAEALGRAVGNLQRLRYVDLRFCQIADLGCTGISHGIHALTELEDLNLAHNIVKDDGFNNLATAIRTYGLSRLKSVDMRYNHTQLPSVRCGPQCFIRNHIVSKLSTESSVSCLMWNAVGDQFASRSHDGVLIIWDAKTLEQVSSLSSVSSVAWCPMRDQIACGFDDGTKIMWDVTTGNQIWKIENVCSDLDDEDYDDKNIEDMDMDEWAFKPSEVWSPEGDQYASASRGKTIIIWDAKTGVQISKLEGHTSEILCVAWRPGGDQIASGSYDNTVIIWDAKTGEQVSMLKGHTNWVTSVAWRPGGDQIASASNDFTIIIWDAKTRQQISKLKGHSFYVTTMAWRPVGDQIAAGSGRAGSAMFGKGNPGEIIIWDAKTGDQVWMLKSHTRGVTSLAWCPGGDQIVSGGYGSGDAMSWESKKYSGEIIIWDVKAGDPVSTLKGHTSTVQSVSWCPGDDQIVSGGYGSGDARFPWDNPGEIKIWNAKTGKLVAVLKGHTKGVTSVAWCPGGDQIASASSDHTIIVWDAKTCDQDSTLKGHTAAVTSVAWHPGGDQIASASYDKTIIMWDAKTGQQISTLKGHVREVSSVAWRPGGDQIASASYDNTVIIWNAKTGGQVSTLSGHSGIVKSAAWRSGDDQIASASIDQTIIIWDAKSGEQVGTLKSSTKHVASVAWRPAGDQIAIVSSDKTITVWDAKTGEQVSTLTGHKDWVRDIAWNSDGTQIASASDDKAIIIWDLRAGGQVSTLEGYTADAMSMA